MELPCCSVSFIRPYVQISLPLTRSRLGGRTWQQTLANTIRDAPGGHDPTDCHLIGGVWSSSPHILHPTAEQMTQVAIVPQQTVRVRGGNNTHNTGANDGTVGAAGQLYTANLYVLLRA